VGNLLENINLKDPEGVRDNITMNFNEELR
jgi:hypothetical protein